MLGHDSWGVPLDRGIFYFLNRDSYMYFWIISDKKHISFFFSLLVSAHLSLSVSHVTSLSHTKAPLSLIPLSHLIDQVTPLAPIKGVK